MNGLRAPASVDALHALLRDPPMALSKRLRECADLILDKHDRVAVSTLSQLTEGTAVQPSAFVRLCKHLGYSGFTELQRVYRNSFDHQALSYAERLSQLGPQNEEADSSLWAAFLEAGRMSIEDLIETVSVERVTAAAKLIAKARMVHVVGANRSFAIASHMAYTLGQMNIPVVQHLITEHANPATTMQKGDVMVATTFAPYSAQTRALSQTAKERGLAIVAITDVAARGLAGIADISLNIRDREVNRFRGLSASITLATALAVFAGQYSEL